MAFKPWQPANRITAGRLAAISPTWQDWTPAWTTSSGLNVPAFGNATVDGQWCQSADKVDGVLDITFGSSTNFGGGGAGDNWFFSLPVAAGVPAGTTIGFVAMRQSNSLTVMGRLRVASNTAYMILSIHSGRADAVAVASTGDVDSVSPWTWASGNSLHGTFTYEPV